MQRLLIMLQVVSVGLLLQNCYSLDMEAAAACMMRCELRAQLKWQVRAALTFAHLNYHEHPNA